MRRDLRLAILGLALSPPCFIVVVVLSVLAANRQEAIERRGVQVVGEVISFVPAGKFGDVVTYRYRYDEREYRGKISYSNAYEEGQRVKVFVDPADPERSTLYDEEPQSGLESAAVGIAGATALVAGPCGAYGLWAWKRRRSVLRAVPWSKASFRIEKRRLGGVRLVGDARVGEINISRVEANRLNRMDARQARLLFARHGRTTVVTGHWRDELAIGRVRRRLAWRKAVGRGIVDDS